MNIKQVLKDTFAKILPKQESDPVLTKFDKLARELLVSQTLASLADARKKRAKAEAVEAGLVLAEYRTGEVEAFRSDLFVVTAKTKEPGKRLDAELLLTNLIGAGLSRAKASNAIADAYIENKPATSYEVVQR